MEKESSFALIYHVEQHLRVPNPIRENYFIYIAMSASYKEAFSEESFDFFYVNLHYACIGMMDNRHPIYEKYPKDPYFVAGFKIHDSKGILKENRLEIVEARFRPERREFYNQVFPEDSIFLNALLESGIIDSITME